MDGGLLKNSTTARAKRAMSARRSSRREEAARNFKSAKLLLMPKTLTQPRYFMTLTR
jgi:hypothetical protein